MARSPYRFWIPIALVVAGALVLATPARALPPEALKSVVSVLPLWPGKPQGGAGTAAGVAPEGSGIVLRGDGIIVTAWHVVETAERVDVRFADGRILPAQILGMDEATDVALLKVDERLPAISFAPRPGIADKACVIGNAYGLGLSVTCGVVSAIDVTDAGFNQIEDFIQTDAAANPGSSGGALVDADGRLLGMMASIFASRSDTNIGINFAVSTELLSRVSAALLSGGTVAFGTPGWRLAHLERPELARLTGVRIASTSESGPANDAGLLEGDILQEIAGRPVKSPRDAVTALALQLPGNSFSLLVLRNGDPVRVAMRLHAADASASAAGSERPKANDDCPYSNAVCITRQAVFPVESFDPLASAVRIGPEMLVTNRHVVADRTEATIYTPNGPRTGKVVASGYRGDLVLLQVEGLPDNGLILSPIPDSAGEPATYHAVGADLAQRQVRVFAPGDLLMKPAENAALGRMHVSAHMQPGVSGGALIDTEGRLRGIAAGGGEGRFEAIPVEQVIRLLSRRSDPDASKIQTALGTALAACVTDTEELEGTPRGQRPVQTQLEHLVDACLAADNAGQLVETGRVLGMAGALDGAIALHLASVEQVPNSANNRLSLLISLQLAARFEEMVPHADWLLEAAPEDPQAQRIAIQAGVWGKSAELAERALEHLQDTNPAQAVAARRFVDQPPPAPVRR